MGHGTRTLGKRIGLSTWSKNLGKRWVVERERSRREKGMRRRKKKRERKRREKR
jgi:hypothetical protein